MKQIETEDETLILPKVKKGPKIKKLGTVILKDAPNIVMENTELRIYQVRIDNVYYMRLAVKKPNQQLQWGENIRPCMSDEYIVDDTYEYISNQFGALVAGVVLNLGISELVIITRLLCQLGQYELLCQKSKKRTISFRNCVFAAYNRKRVTKNAITTFSCKDN